MIPVLPSELRALIPEANAPLCLVLRRFWQWAMERQKLRLYCFTSDGDGTLTLTDDFKSDLCTDINDMGVCANLMSTPTNPPLSGVAFRALIPAATDALCLKTQPAIINFMDADTRDWEWMFTETGGVPKISESFRSALCTLDCLGGGGTDGCPPFQSVLTLEPGNAKITLHYVGQGIKESGYEYEIYRGTTLVLLDAAIAAGAVSGPALATGTLDGASLTHVDTGLTNDTSYFYYIRVRKTSCAWVGSQKPFETPSECRIFNNIAMTVVAGASGSRTLTIRVEAGDGIGLPTDMTYSIWRAHTYATKSELLGSGVVSDHPGTDAQGKVCLAFEHVDATVGDNNWYFTVEVKEAGATCSTIALYTPSGSPEHYPVPQPEIRFTAVEPVLFGATVGTIRVKATYTNPNTPPNVISGGLKVDVVTVSTPPVFVTTMGLTPDNSTTEFICNIPIGAFNRAITPTGVPNPKWHLDCLLLLSLVSNPETYGGDINNGDQRGFTLDF